MSKILLSQEVKRVQNELRRLSSLLRKPNKFKMTLSKEGADTVATLEKWVQDNIDLLGSYKVDDVDANLDVNKSVIANLSVAVSNITAILNREKEYMKADDLLRTLNEAKAYTDTELAKLQKEVDVIKSAGVHIPHFDTEANRDRVIPNPDDGQVCYVGANGAWVLNTYEAGAWVKGITSQHSTSASDPKKAEVDLSNVNLGVANAGMTLKVQADGSVKPEDTGWKEIDDLWTNPDKFEKYKDKIIRISTNTANTILTGFESQGVGNKLLGIIDFEVCYIASLNPNKVQAGNNEYDVKKVEVM